MAATRGTEYLPLDGLSPDPRNPKSHSVEVIGQSVGRFGLIDQIVRDDRTGYIISGHGRTKTLRKMRDEGQPAPEGVQVAEDGTWLVPVAVGWASKDDQEAGAALVALNRTSEIGGWDETALHAILADLSNVDDGLEGIGFDEAEIERLHDSLDALGGDDPTGGVDDDPELEPSGRAFKDLDVLVGEPKHDTPHGAVYELGGRHLLVVAKLALEHDQWSPYLEGRMFAPYPDVYIALGEVAKEQQLLMVQPSRYLAGHILDKWASVHGEDSIVQVNR